MCVGVCHIGHCPTHAHGRYQETVVRPGFEEGLPPPPPGYSQKLPSSSSTSSSSSPSSSSSFPLKTLFPSSVLHTAGCTIATTIFSEIVFNRRQMFYNSTVLN